jgi:hypothetical protein
MALSEKQFKVINDLFEAGGDESAVRQKHNISYRLWHKWLNDKNFTDGIARRLESSKRSSQILLAQYNSLAAAKLVQLCGSNNAETSRKACMDILELEAGLKQVSQTSTNEPVEPERAIDPVTASKLLAALAEKENP